jgi:hypothetical protein
MELDISKLLHAGETVAREIFTMSQGMIFPTVIVMEFDDKDNDIPMLPSSDKVWRTKVPGSREWALKRWSDDATKPDSPEQEICNFIKQKKGAYFIAILTESMVVKPPQTALTKSSFMPNVSDEKKAEIRRTLPNRRALLINIVIRHGSYARAIAINAPDRTLGETIVDKMEIAPPHWIKDAVQYSDSKLGNGEALN